MGKDDGSLPSHSVVLQILQQCTVYCSFNLNMHNFSTLHTWMFFTSAHQRFVSRLRFCFVSLFTFVTDVSHCVKYRRLTVTDRPKSRKRSDFYVAHGESFLWLIWFDSILLFTVCAIKFLSPSVKAHTETSLVLFLTIRWILIFKYTWGYIVPAAVAEFLASFQLPSRETWGETHYSTGSKMTCWVSCATWLTL